MGDESDKSQKGIDEAHHLGELDAAAGGDKKPPHEDFIVTGFLSEQQEKENKAYDHGHDAASE